MTQDRIDFCLSGREVFLLQCEPSFFLFLISLVSWTIGKASWNPSELTCDKSLEMLLKVPSTSCKSYSLLLAKHFLVLFQKLLSQDLKTLTSVLGSNDSDCCSLLLTHPPCLHPLQISSLIKLWLISPCVSALSHLLCVSCASLSVSDKYG